MTAAANTSRDEILRQIRELAASDWGIGPALLTESARVSDLPDVDSVKQIRLTAKMEQLYGIRLISEDTRPATTIGEFVDQVLAGLNRRG